MRTSLRASKLSLPRGSTRQFSQCTSRCRQYKTEGRTPGFARRARPLRTPQRTHIKDDPKSPVSTELATAHVDNSLLAPVHIIAQDNGILDSSHPATSILSNSSIVIQRQYEPLNVFAGLEQANKYIIKDPRGNTIGYLAAADGGLFHIFDLNEKEVLRFQRQTSFLNSSCHVYDPVDTSARHSSSHNADDNGTTALATQDQVPAKTSQLPLSSMRQIGEAQKEWTPFRRKYNLFLTSYDEQTTVDSHSTATSKAVMPSNSSNTSAPLSSTPFARADEPRNSLSFSFNSSSSDTTTSPTPLGSVAPYSNFATTASPESYVLRLDSASLPSPSPSASMASPTNAPTSTPGSTLDQRAVMLAAAISIDTDYLSRAVANNSVGGGGPWFMPIWFPMPFGWGGGGAAEAGAGAEGAAAGGAGVGAMEAGEAGTAVRGAGGATGVGAMEAGEAGTAVRGAGGATGAGEGAVAGAGGLAGYDALQGRNGPAGSADEFVSDEQVGMGQQGQQGAGQDPWGSGGQDPWGGRDQDPWGGGGGGGGQGGGGGGQGGGGGGGDGGGFDFDDFF